MTLNNLIENLKYLQNAGFGDLKVFGRDSSSGACGSVHTARVTNLIEKTGPFDLNPKEYYIEICIENN